VALPRGVKEGPKLRKTQLPIEQLYKVRDVVNLTRLSLKTVKRTIAAGELRVVRVGARSIRVPESALRAWLASRGQAA
jgi:excisionase family DNA binding protein